MLALVFSTVLAAVQVDSDRVSGASEPRHSGGGVYTLVLENDLFAGSDRQYTNGIRIESMAPAGAPFEFISNAARIVPFSGLGPDATYRRGWSLSHLLYSASDISLENPPEDDHPYAGYLALSVFSTAIQDNSENTLSFELGLIGPSAQGEFVQRNWHQHVLHEAIDPAGWSTQLHDEVVFAASLQRLRRWDVLSSQRWNTDAYTHVGATLGTVRTDLSAGFFTRWWLGDIPAGVAAPPRIRPAISASSYVARIDGWNAYVFGGFASTWVGRDIFLDGNTFRASRSVDKRDVVWSAQAGIAVQWEHVRVSYTHIVRSDQFATQREQHRFGSLAVSFVR